MRRLVGMPILIALALCACVTINVYFPAAEAREAAKEFVEKIIDVVPPAGNDGMAAIDEAPASGSRFTFDPLALVGIGSAHAQSQPDFNIQTPAITAIQNRMEQRFDAVLRAHFDSGALGFTSNGEVSVRDAGSIPMAQRAQVNQAVAEQNRDARAVYREIAVANGQPDWEPRIRQVFAEQWVQRAKGGWWYQDAGGSWRQK